MKNSHYQFTVLLFGLSAAPQVFTKCMAVVAAFLRRLGVQICPYLIDWLVKDWSRAQVVSSVQHIQSTFKAPGLLVNSEKSTLCQLQKIEFIGAVLDPTQSKAFFPELPFQTILSLVTHLKCHPSTTAPNCMKLLGHMALCTYVVQHKRLHLRPLQTWLDSVYSPSHLPLDAVLMIPSCILVFLNWWLDPLNVCADIPFICLNCQ